MFSAYPSCQGFMPIEGKPAHIYDEARVSVYSSSL